jgi:MinD superfamily P-loop ATPase
MRDTIFYVGGGTGGVGKSMVSMTLVQFFIDKYGESKTIHLIETDESNPDVGRMYKELSINNLTIWCLSDTYKKIVLGVFLCMKYWRIKSNR